MTKYTVLPMYHPAAALRVPHLWATLIDDWQHRADKVDSNFRVTNNPEFRHGKNLPKLFALDTENDKAGQIGAWSIAYRNAEGQLCAEPFAGANPNFNVPDDCMVIAQNWKWDKRVLENNKMSTPKNVVDTMIAAYCLIPSTKILYRDLTWRPIGEAKVGDELIGVDETPTKTSARKMRPSIITGVGTREAQCYEIMLDDGRILTSTGEHPWLVQRKGSNRSVWRKTSELQIGWRMPSSLEPWSVDTSREGGYLSGILDGEGWVNSNFLSVGIAQNPGRVLEETKTLLTSKEFNFKESACKDSKCHRLSLSGNRQLMKLLGSLRPVRLLPKEFWNGKSPKSINQPVLTITGIKMVGVEQVVNISTTTHTFNAEGCWTHNCLGYGKQDPKDGNKDGGKMVGGLGLKYLARRHLGMQMNNWQEVVDKNLDMVEYNCKDSIAAYLLWEKWVGILPKHFWTIDMPLLNVLMKMEDRGVLVDSDFLVKYAESLDERLATLDLKGINPYSPDQVAKYVYEDLGYTPTRFTDTKKPSTDAEALENIEDPVVKAILEYREVYMEKKKGVSGYAHTDHEGRIHTEFKQTRTATGRLSSANPNLQNVSKGEMRKLFIAKPGHKLIILDWKKIEYGILAVVSHDAAMMKAFRADTIHQDTADALGVSYDEGKVANFLMQYEGSAWKLSLEFGISIDEASRMLYSYYKKYPGIQEYHRQMKEIAHAKKEVVNIFGRVRRLDGMYTEDKKTIRDAEKQAINTPIQGAAGEIVKLAMIALDKHDAPMLLQVHDELMFEVPEKDAVDYAHWLNEYVPTITEIEGERFYVDVGIGNNWQEAKAKENIVK